MILDSGTRSSDSFSAAAEAPRRLRLHNVAVEVRDEGRMAMVQQRFATVVRVEVARQS